MSDVRVKITADSTALTTGLNAAGVSVNAFAVKTNIASVAVGKMQAAMVTAGAVASKAMGSMTAALGPLMVGLAAFVGLSALGNAAGQINDLSQRFGESAETIQRVKYVADQSGTSLETVAKSMNKAELAAVAAASGNEEMNQAFESLGISAQEFADLSMEERLAAMADGYEKNTNKAQALAAMVKIMGKSAGELIPMFAQGGAAVTEMMNEASVASSNSIARIDEVQDRFSGLFETLKAWAFDALGFVIDLIDKMSVGIAAAIAFVSNLTEGIDAAKQAYNDTLEAGLNYLEEEKVGREERKNKISSANIQQLQQEAAEEESGKAQAKADKEADKGNDKIDDYWQVMEDAKKDASNKAIDDAEKKAKADAKAKKKADIEATNEKLGESKDQLSKLERQSDSRTPADVLRKIGGGFGKSDYSALSKDEMRLQKQIDLAQKQYDRLKEISDALKKTETTDGITS